ncbi:MAG: hypothetical protein WDO16_17750 [Bacteroidota bacterium]
MAAASTYATGSDLSQNWDSKTYGQQVDGLMSVGSGTLSTATGGLVASTLVGGTAAEMVLGGATFTEAVGTAATVAGGLLSATAAGGAVVAAGGGLAIYGFANEGSKYLFDASLAEVGDQGEGLMADIVRYTSSDPNNEYEQFGSERLDKNQGVGWKRSNKYLEARKKVEERGSRGGSGGPRWKAKKPGCPQNGGGGGSQSGGSGSGGGGGGGKSEVISSADPNEIIGPDGAPDKNWVSIKDRLPYTILYENDKSATAPAKYVKIISPNIRKNGCSQFPVG